MFVHDRKLVANFWFQRIPIYPAIEFFIKRRAVVTHEERVFSGRSHLEISVGKQFGSPSLSNQIHITLINRDITLSTAITPAFFNAIFPEAISCFLNKLFGYMKELEALGCRVIESDSFVDVIVNIPDDSVRND